MHRWSGFGALAVLGSGCGGAEARGPKAASEAPFTSELPAAAVASTFWPHWGDGRAEIDTYTLTIPRYGALRSGTAVLVFVTEDFTEATRVKSDGGHGDEFPVLKLNDVRHFQTGIYDYETMTSTFVAADGRAPAGLPVKVSLGVQEWCGHVYEQLVPRGAAVHRVGHSYFDGEADHDEWLNLPADGALADAFPIVARGLLGAWPAPGTEAAIEVLPTLLASRFAHVPPAWTGAVVRRGADAESVTVPAGTFDAVPVELALAEGTATTWYVEVEAPHRIVRWRTSAGEVAELVASERLPYWTMNGEADAARLAELGLAPNPPATPPPTPGGAAPTLAAPTP